MVSVNSLSGSAGAYQSLIQKQRASANAAFGSDDGAKSMESNAAAYSLYNKPGLLTGLTQWDGSTKSASQRAAATATSDAAKGVKPKYSFNPFDRKTWDVKPAAPKTSAADPSKTATPPPPAGTKTGTGKVIAAPTYSFNPFDRKSWDVKAPKGNNVDALS
jgi:hypothetical protein